MPISAGKPQFHRQQLPIAQRGCQGRHGGGKQHAHRLDEGVARQAERLQVEDSRHDERPGHAVEQAAHRTDQRRQPALAAPRLRQLDLGEARDGVGEHDKAQQACEQIAARLRQHPDAEPRRQRQRQQQRPEPAQDRPQVAAGQRLPHVGDE
jgi:hypothetical protein